ncbi:hypothetical protein ACOYR1_02465 [Thalassotalea piscium]
MFSLKKVTLVVVSSLAAAFYVSANEPVKIMNEVNKVDLTQLLSKFDNDSNGALSKAEVAASKHSVLVDNFDAIDSNKDGGLSEDELKAFSQGK